MQGGTADNEINYSSLTETRILSRTFFVSEKNDILEEKNMQYNGIDFDTYFKNYPDKNGYFGKYGGAYISDELKAAMAEINDAYFTICKSRKFIAELRRIRKEFQEDQLRSLTWNVFQTLLEMYSFT